MHRMCDAHCGRAGFRRTFVVGTCQSLYEVIYPWNGQREGSAESGRPLRWLWQERRTSTQAVDQSGGLAVFAICLPIVKDFETRHHFTRREIRHCTSCRGRRRHWG